MIKLEKCPICKDENWQDLDKLRNHTYWYDKDMREKDEPVGFKVCKGCGFVTYDYVDIERLSEHYDGERPVMQANNIVTCNRKNVYHGKFLIDEYMLDTCPELNILDVGCAQGSFLNYFKEKGFSFLYGTEWSKSFANFARHEYGLNITKEIDESIIYDFISYYHVLEHIQDPDKELNKIRKLLSDDGYLYISVPYFLDDLEEKSGTLTADFENLYHLNHVNVFTKGSIRNLLGVCGFEIVKEDDKMYGYTILCKKASNDYKIIKEQWGHIEGVLKNQKEAIGLFVQKKFDDAINVYNKYPDAFIGKCLDKMHMKDFDKAKSVIIEGLNINPDNLKLKKQLAQLYFQWDENTPEKQYYSNNIKESERLLLELLEDKPGQEDVYYFLGMINTKYKKEQLKAVEYFKKVLEINPMKFAEMYNMISYCYKEM